MPPQRDIRQTAGARGRVTQFNTTHPYHTQGSCQNSCTTISLQRAYFQLRNTEGKALFLNQYSCERFKEKHYKYCSLVIV